MGLFLIYSEILDEEFGDFRVTVLPRGAILSAASTVELAAPNPVKLVPMTGGRLKLPLTTS